MTPTINDAFGWPDDARWSEAHKGENETWRVDTGAGNWAAKRYREGVAHGAVESEAAWWRALADVDPRVVEDGGRVWLVTPWLEGDAPEPDWKRLGRLLSGLHARAGAVAEPRHWPGWRRPRYSRRELIDGPLERLSKAPFLTAADRDRARRLALHAPDPEKLAAPAFVHMDAHFGNLIATPAGWHLIDFEECGFGPQTLDLGVARLHLRAQQLASTSPVSISKALRRLVATRANRLCEYCLVHKDNTFFGYCSTRAIRS